MLDEVEDPQVYRWTPVIVRCSSHIRRERYTCVSRGGEVEQEFSMAAVASVVLRNSRRVADACSHDQALRSVRVFVQKEFELKGPREALMLPRGPQCGPLVTYLSATTDVGGPTDNALLAGS